MTLLSSITHLRNNSRLIKKLPPYLSLLCIIVGVAWLLILPLDGYCRKTYISENALLPGQVHTYFGGSDQNVFRAFKHEVDSLAFENNEAINDRLQDIFSSAGLKVARQKYEYESSGVRHSGENIYAILQAPRGDATEAIVLVGPWRTLEGKLNGSGVALVLTLARYFKRWSLWSKDIIFLVTPDSRAGSQAWVDAYHDTHSSSFVEPLPLKSGALQGAIVVDYPFDHRFESIHIVYDGINGQLPNLDLFNSVGCIATGQMGIGVSLQKMWKHEDTYQDRLQTMLRGMLNQGLGHATGAHSSFIPYHVDAITLQPYGEGWQDEMAMGRVIEGTFRSLNNLLEHLHQSFFFYLLMQVEHFVSIGTYLPSAMLVAVNFTIMAIALWLQSGRPEESKEPELSASGDPTSIVASNPEKERASSNVPKLRVAERELFFPIAVVAGAHFLGLVPLYIFNHSPEQMLTVIFAIFSVSNTLLPYLIATSLFRHFQPTVQQYRLTKSFSLLLLGMFLASLATLNFSQAFLVGLLSTPLTYIQPLPRRPFMARLALIMMSIISPPAVLFTGSYYWHLTIGDVLKEAAFAWDVSGMTTQVVFWCVWWPAWLVGSSLLLGVPKIPTKEQRSAKQIAG